MHDKRIRVLVTDGGGRQTLSILHDLKKIDCITTVLCQSKLDLCYVSNVPNMKILDKCADASNADFDKFLYSLVQTGEYDVLLPIAEMSTNKVTMMEEELKKYVKLTCAPRSSYIKAFDKQQTFELAIKQKIPCPKTKLDSQTVEEFISAVKFPIVIKPRNGVGAVGFRKFDDSKDFWQYVRENEINLEKFVLQEYVDHKMRLGAILFIDQENNVCMSYADEVLRWYPIKAGSACLIRSIDHPKILDWSAKLLQTMNWRGLAAVSFMIEHQTNDIKLLEINGRIPASIRLSSQCGFNVAKLLIEMAQGLCVEKYANNTTFGQMTRHFHADVAWFLRSQDRFKSEPSWFNWKNTKDVVFWRGDIKPWFAYTIQKLIGFKSFISKHNR